MNCLSRIEIQEYLDKEVDPVIYERISQHLESCRECSMLYSQAAADRELVHKFLNIGEQQDRDVAIPVFRRPEIYRKQITAFRLIPYIVAASLIAFIVLVRYDKTPDITGIPEAEILLYQYYEGQDLNKMWHEKSQLIILQDDKGNIIEPIVTN